MAKPTEAVDRTAILNGLNKAVTDEETFLNALKEARALILKTALPSGGSPNPRHRKPRKRRTGVSHGSRTQMLQTILDHSDKPVTVQEIELEMAKHGRIDDRRLVYSTLSYLARKGTAKTSERGKWVSITQVESQQEQQAA